MTGVQTCALPILMELADDAAGRARSAAVPSRSAPAQSSALEPAGTVAPIAAAAGEDTRAPAAYTPRTLKCELQQRPRLPLGECLSIGLELATALEVLHTRGLVHRDVKPSNIIFLRGEAKLADIGLVAKYENTLSQVGADGYIPALGASKPQADLFALGKVLYEMSTGMDRLECPRSPSCPSRTGRGFSNSTGSFSKRAISRRRAGIKARRS